VIETTMKTHHVTLLGVMLVAALWIAPVIGAAEPEANTWTKAPVDFDKPLRAYLGDKKGRWSTIDGYSDNVYRSATGAVLIRTGVHSKALGLSPGYYTNATVEWDLKTDTARIVEVANWSGGSYGHGALLPGYAKHPTPAPRHTYDGICYVPRSDSMYMMLGANWKVGGRGASEQARAELKKDAGRTWAYSFEKKRWRCIEDNVWKHFKCSPYENHMAHWPKGKKLLFLNDRGDKYARFDLATQKWTAAATDNKPPMSLYNARSAWDAKRSLWIFRLGPRLCVFDPARNRFESLPNCYDMPIPSRDELRKMKKSGARPDARLHSKGVCYISTRDRYLVCGPTGDDTAAYDPKTRKWTAIKGGKIELPNGYMQYNAKLDIVAMNYQLDCFKFKRVPKDRQPAPTTPRTRVRRGHEKTTAPERTGRSGPPEPGLYLTDLRHIIQ